MDSVKARRSEKQTDWLKAKPMVKLKRMVTGKVMQTEKLTAKLKQMGTDWVKLKDFAKAKQKVTPTERPTPRDFETGMQKVIRKVKRMD